jgi:spermidine synthase
MKDRLLAAKTAVPFLFFLSGAAALVYESLWMRQFALIFGNTTYSVTVTLAAFMGGIALGSRWITRLPVRDPARLYALAEAGAGATALATLLLLRRLPHWYGGLGAALPAPLELALRVLSAAMVIMPTTILLGFTFPLLAEFLHRAAGSGGSGAGRPAGGMHAGIGALYRVNTLGGAGGVLAAGFLLLPALGVTGLFAAAAAADLAIGALFWILAPRSLPAARPRAAAGASKAASAAPVDAPARPLLFAVLAFCSGAASFGLEVLCTRSLALVIGSSYYSFNTMLAAFLLGIVLGALVYRALSPRRPLLLAGALFAALGLLALLEVALLGALPRQYFALMGRLGSSFLAHQAAGFGLSLLAMLPLTTLFGITFPLLARLPGGEEAREISGSLYLWNTMGSILGALATGFLLVPLAGLQASFVWCAGMLLVPGLLAMLAALPHRVVLRAAAGLAAAALLAVAGLFYRPWDPLLMTAGVYKYGLEWRGLIPSGRALQEGLRKYRSLLFYREGREAVVSVTRSEAGTFLAINGKIDAGTQADTATQKLLAHVPLALHPAPKTAFIVGWGSGCTAGSAALYPLREIHCAEIEPAVFEAAPLFEELNRGVQRDPRFTVHLQDARSLLLAGGPRYDLIISEPSNPWVSGMASLFTAEFYDIVAGRLEEGGLFCQWFHYYDLGLQDLRVQAATFCRRFPYASLWLVPPSKAGPEDRPTPVGDILLLGSLRPLSLDYRRVQAAWSLPGVREDLGAAGIRDGLELLAAWTADREDLLAFAGRAPENTDERPLLELNAPRGLYSATNSREQRLAMYAALSAVGSEALPPLENHPAFAPAGAATPAPGEAAERSGAREAVAARLAGLYDAWLQPARARRAEAAGSSP